MLYPSMAYGGSAAALAHGFGPRHSTITLMPSFKTSPFYRVDTVIGDVRICEGWCLMSKTVSASN